MTIGLSLLLTAIGAILAFAINDRIEGVDLYTAGIITMIVGIIGLFISLIVYGYGRRDERTYDRP